MKNPIKSCIYGNKLNNMILLISILFLTYITLCIGMLKRTNLYINNCEITLLIKDKGKAKILSDSFSLLPNSISIDNVNQGNKKKEYEFNKANAKVIMIYDELNSCENMFNGVTVFMK